MKKDNLGIIFIFLYKICSATIRVACDNPSPHEMAEGHIVFTLSVCFCVCVCVHMRVHVCVCPELCPKHNFLLPICKQNYLATMIIIIRQCVVIKNYIAVLMVKDT